MIVGFRRSGEVMSGVVPGRRDLLNGQFGDRPVACSLMTCRRTRRAAALVAVLLIAAACQTNARAGTRCRTTDLGDDGVSVLKCENGRWVRKASNAQVAQLLQMILRSRVTTTTSPPPTTPSASQAQPVSQVSTPRPAGGRPYGIDVSNWQHPNGAAIDWGLVRGDGNQFVFMKATEGPSGSRGDLVNPYFAADWHDAGSVGLLRGAYHFARPTLPLDSALLQARNFVATTGSMQGPADLPPVLDVEVSGGLTPADLVSWVQTWVNEVQALTGRQPIIYTGLNFWNGAAGGSAAFSGYRLWFARYLTGDSPGPLPNGFGASTFWQYTSTGTVSGISTAVDLNVYCCNQANLLALAGPSTNQAAGSPFGVADTIAGGPDGRVEVGGWSIDPDVAGPIETHVYIDGVGTNLGLTTVSRPDIAAAYPQFGTMHGFSWATTGLTPGPHNVCVFAINQGYGSNTLLRCQTIVSPSGSPVGHVDAVQPITGGATVAGWALDPDTAGRISVAIVVDSSPAVSVTTDVDRSDIAANYPSYGPTHGFNSSITGLASGSHTICTTATNVGGGSDTPLGCTQIIVP